MVLDLFVQKMYADQKHKSRVNGPSPLSPKLTPDRSTSNIRIWVRPEEIIHAYRMVYALSQRQQPQDLGSVGGDH
jgi:hypothetical protein